MKYRRRVNEVEAIKLSFNNMEDLKNIQDVLGEPFLNVDFPMLKIQNFWSKIFIKIKNLQLDLIKIIL
mgnify:CR=1 FL=1